MADSCATCFFFRAEGSTCRRQSPVVNFVPHDITFAWPKVHESDWCGLGADATTHISFTPKIRENP